MQKRQQQRMLYAEREDMKKRMYKADSDTNYLQLQDAVSFFNMSASTIKKLAKECDAKMKIGSIARYRKDILEDYIESMQKRA